jgi:hypothetical protein
MSSHFKALFIVMVITLAVFVLAKPLLTRFTRVEEYARRRNTWLALTLAAFLIPNYWAFVAVAIPIICYAVSKESNPAALYLFLMPALPPVSLDIPTFGLVNQIFPLDHYRLLSLVLVLPAALKLHRTARASSAGNGHGAAPGFGWLLTDILLLSYAALQVALLMPYESFTAVGRRIVMLILDVLLPYFVISRTCRSRANIVEAMASFATAAAVLAPMAVFEYFKFWLLFASLEETWGAMQLHNYLTREGHLRATVTMGHSIMLGYSMTMAFGFWLYLQSRVDSRAWRWLGLVTIVAGLVVAMARGPWVGSLAVLVIFLVTGPKAASRTVKGVALFVALAGAVLAPPWGGRFIDFLPFVGTVDEGTVTYRQQIASTSWQLIQQNPLFGSRFFAANMENLRQGEGIVDVLNVYATVALSYGLGGLVLFAGFFIVAGLTCFAVARRSAKDDPDFSLMGSGLLASMVGALVIISTVSNYLIVPYLYWSLGALAVAYTQLAKASAAVPAQVLMPNMRSQAR